MVEMWEFRLVLGHLIGDYLLQSKAMALKKSEKGAKGFAWCTFHCLVYTASVCLLLWTLNPWVMAIIFSSHWFIDRWSLTGKWLKLIRGRDLSDKSPLNLAFYPLVYATADNTWHILLMWGGILALFAL